MRVSYNEVSIDHPEALQMLAAPLWKSNWYKLFAVPNSTDNSLMSECDPKRYAIMRSNLASGFFGLKRDEKRTVHGQDNPAAGTAPRRAQPAEEAF